MSKLIPKGDYQAEIVLQETDEGPMSCVLGEAKTGTKQVAIRVRLVDAGEYTGRERTWLGFFTPDTIDSTLDQLRNAGFKGDDISEFPGQRPGGRFPVKVDHDKDREGVVRDRIRWINNAERGGGGFKMEKTMNPTDRKLFAEGIKARLAAKPEVAGAPAPAVTNGASSKHPDPQV